MRRSEKGRTGIVMRLVCLLCLVVFVSGTEAVWGSESADATTSIPPSRVIKRTVGDPSERWITEERVEMLVEKDFWTHRLESVGPFTVGPFSEDLWIIETPFPNVLALGDFLSYPIFFLNDAGNYWLEIIYNDGATAVRSIQVFDNHKY